MGRGGRPPALGRAERFGQVACAEVNERVTDPSPSVGIAPPERGTLAG
jgi:hypothetical protein